MENMQLDLEHLVAMNSLSSSMIYFPIRFFINPRCSAFSPVIELGLKLYFHFSLPVQCDQNLFPSYAFFGYTMCKIFHGSAMATSQSAKKSTQSSRTVRSKPQMDWDALSPTAGIPKNIKGTIPLLAEETRSIHEKYKTEGFAQEGKTTRVFSPRQQIPWRRGKPRKNQDIVEAQISEEP
jgi:hypothetical protein